MQLVCCSLPETKVAGQRVHLAISLDVAWLLFRPDNRDSSPSPPDVSNHPPSQFIECQPSGRVFAEYHAPSLIAHSPSLLLWAMSQLELPIPLCHPDQLVDKVRRIEFSQIMVRPAETPPDSYRNDVRTARFVNSLKAMASKQGASSNSNCKLNRAFGVLASQLTGIDSTLIANWIEQRQIADSFWLALADCANELKPEARPITDLVGKVGTDTVSISCRMDSLHQEKMASLKRLAYGASHEINNPLANIASRAQTLLVDEKDGDRRKTLAKINQQAFRAFEMIADMMLFAHPPQLVIADLELKPLLQTVVNELKDAATEQGTEIELNRVEPLIAQVDGVQISVAIRAVIQNALESLQKAGKVSVNAGPVENGDFLDIIVSDTGPGFRESELPHVFDPFFSGREAGRGLGFGLSKAWRIVEQHGGEIVAENLPHAGARVQIRIPYRVPTNR